MFKIASTALLLGAAYLVAMSVPDVARYIKIRRM